MIIITIRAVKVVQFWNVSLQSSLDKMATNTVSLQLADIKCVSLRDIKVEWSPKGNKVLGEANKSTNKEGVQVNWNRNKDKANKIHLSDH